MVVRVGALRRVVHGPDGVGDAVLLEEGVRVLPLRPIVGGGARRAAAREVALRLQLGPVCCLLREFSVVVVV